MSAGNCIFLATKSSHNDNNKKRHFVCKCISKCNRSVVWSKAFVNCHSAFDEDLEVPRPSEVGDSKKMLLFCLCHCIQA